MSDQLKRRDWNCPYCFHANYADEIMIATVGVMNTAEVECVGCDNTYKVKPQIIWRTIKEGEEE